MKTSGGTRKLKNGSREYNSRLKEVAELKASGKYSRVEFATNGGGYLAIENSPKEHSQEEIEAAQALARNGYKVILLNEAGQAKTKDGKLISMFGFEYEQRTPSLTEAQKQGREKFDAVVNMRNALKHAQSKYADIALVYMKNNLHDVHSVKAGIVDFEGRSQYRFKEILIVTSDGRIHRHKHNK